MNKLLIIASGGGHTGFARAVAEYLPFKADFIIPENDSNSRLLLQPFANRIYEVSKPREPLGSSLSLFSKGLRALSQSLSIPKYKVTLATGSNHSYIPSLVQYLKGTTLYVIESQDRIVTKGRTTYLLSKLSRGVFLHWKEQSALYRKGIVTGPILQRRKYEPKNDGYIFVTAGTEGFKSLFDKIVTLGLDNVVIQTGKIDPSIYRGRARLAFSFDPNIEQFIASSSLVITHQGKTAMESAVLYGKPTIIVFNKALTRAATYEDVRIYSKIIGATFLDDPSTWSNDREILEAIKEARKPTSHEIGTEKLVKVIISAIE
ncbi:polysaccharide biosynthesis protein [Metallosphaera tengchongensis]|uniref:Polysaccharide biosynthesis protein n=1 Tax=Metallosphaera tengchongensis TaxID=1532350 RepID=A0A6N0NTL6_9CREN|nr:glycosyltransferase [Metallosphaera tengchongensis]QKQ99252.1 polysaccharide biosynthesis protein [Metallosphaera tengchongensis]